MFKKLTSCHLATCTILKLVLILLLCLTLPACKVGKIYWVSPKGSNSSGDGSELKPWKTIAYALSQTSTSAADVIRVEAGNYKEKIVISKSVTLLGAGIGKTVIENTQKDKFMFEIQKGVSNVFLGDFSLDCSSTNSGGIKATDVKKLHLANIRVQTPLVYGIWLEKIANFGFSGVEIDSGGLLSDIGLHIDKSKGEISGLKTGQLIDHVVNISDSEVIIRDSEIKGSYIYWADGIVINGNAKVEIFDTKITRTKQGEERGKEPWSEPYAGIDIKGSLGTSTSVLLSGVKVSGFDVGLGVHTSNRSRIVVENSSFAGNRSAEIETRFDWGDVNYLKFIDIIIDLGGGSLGSIGGNTIGYQAKWGVYHAAPYDVAAKRNTWLGIRSSIDDRIRDKHDNQPKLGIVDYKTLQIIKPDIPPGMESPLYNFVP